MFITRVMSRRTKPLQCRCLHHLAKVGVDRTLITSYTGTTLTQVIYISKEDENLYTIQI
jgi:hypothetical protein